MDAATLSQWWLVVSVPALLGGIVLVVSGVVVLLRIVHGPELARLPLSAAQEFELREAGPLSFLVDKPRFRNVQAAPLKPFALTVSLEDAAGRVTKASPALVPLTIEGVARVRTEIASLPGADPGHYGLRIAGLAPDIEGSEAFLVVARPIAKLKLAFCIVAIIVAGALALGGLIASIATFVKFQSG